MMCKGLENVLLNFPCFIIFVQRSQMMSSNLLRWLIAYYKKRLASCWSICIYCLLAILLNNFKYGQWILIMFRQLNLIQTNSIEIFLSSDFRRWISKNIVDNNNTAITTKVTSNIVIYTSSNIGEKTIHNI